MHRSICRFYIKVFIFIIDIIVFSCAVIMYLKTPQTRQKLSDNMELLSEHTLVSHIYF